MKKKYDVQGMTCSACSAAVEREVSKLQGVTRVSVNLLANNMQVDFDEEVLTPD
jgi:Cu+-exporting ATPase